MALRLQSFFNIFKTHKSILLVLLLFIISFIARILRVAHPSHIISDELYYVTAARSIISTGRDPNLVHPPLGKYFIGLGILIFGDNSFGWRIIGAFLGSTIAPLAYLIGNKVYNEKVGILSGVFLLLDPLTYAMSCIAMLDIYLAFFITCAFLAFVYQRYHMSAVLFGLACSVKFSAVFSICGVMIYLIYVRKWKLVQWFVIIPLLVFLIVVLPIMLVEGIGKWLAYTLFYLAWSFGLKAEHPFTSRPEGWLFNIKPFPLYLNTYELIVTANPFLYPLVLPVSVYIVYLVLKNRLDCIEMLPVLWFVNQYGFFFLLPRTTQFIFYLLPSVPAILLLTARGILAVLEVLSKKLIET
ncbi:MAG: glycosyltransferase family 39 protein [Candidatus Lokiarchaeota archaeon]|nr:glycosyltransferase family 39 protein [Candidatus Lokiarchaeota archaeon]